MSSSPCGTARWRPPSSSSRAWKTGAAAPKPAAFSLSPSSRAACAATPSRRRGLLPRVQLVVLEVLRALQRRLERKPCIGDLIELDARRYGDHGLGVAALAL